ncbi:MAG: hypothetical protein Kow0069_12280 [Promethearchaeota archaeon]
MGQGAVMVVDLDVAAAAWNAAFTASLAVVAALLFHVSTLAFSAENRYGGVSTLCTACLVGSLAVYNQLVGLVPFPYSGFMSWWVGPCVGLYVGYALAVWLKDRRRYSTNPSVRRAEEIVDKELYKVDISFKMELVRKGFHLFGFLLVASFYGVGFGSVAGIVNDNTVRYINRIQGAYESLWGPLEQYPFPVTDTQAVASLTMFALVAALFFAVIPELIRVLSKAKYSLYNKLTGAVLRGKEYKAIGPQIYLLVGVTFSYLFYHPLGLIPVEVVMTGALSACFSDAAAAVVGRGWGKRKVKVHNGDTKSVEGFVAGVGLTFLIGLLLVGPTLALVAAFTFFLLDYFPTVVADNLLNPIAISFGVALFAFATGVPVGW